MVRMFAQVRISWHTAMLDGAVCTFYYEMNSLEKLIHCCSFYRTCNDVGNIMKLEILMRKCCVNYENFLCTFFCSKIINLIFHMTKIWTQSFLFIHTFVGIQHMLNTLIFIHNLFFVAWIQLLQFYFMFCFILVPANYMENYNIQNINLRHKPASYHIWLDS